MRPLLTLALCLSLACGDDDTGGADAGRSDAGRTDAGGAEDAGDAVDTGRTEDAGGTEDTGGAEDGGAEDAGADDAGPRDCGPEQPVDGPAALDALAPDPYGRPGFRSEWQSTSDLVATTAFRVLASDFTKPSDCDDFCETSLFADGDIPGVTAARGGGYDIAEGARFRLRFTVQFLAPAGDFAQIHIQRPCTADCPERARRCDEDMACYTEGGGYCSACDHEPQQRCACVTPDGDAPDGTDCIIVTGDIAESGRCMDGFCERVE